MAIWQIMHSSKEITTDEKFKYSGENVLVGLTGMFKVCFQ